MNKKTKKMNKKSKIRWMNKIKKINNKRTKENNEQKMN